MKPFQGVDYFRFDSLLSEEEIMIRDEVRRFVENEAKPVLTRHHREGTFPLGLVKPMADMGLLGANLHGYGCRAWAPPPTA